MRPPGRDVATRPVRDGFDLAEISVAACCTFRSPHPPWGSAMGASTRKKPVGPFRVTAPHAVTLPDLSSGAAISQGIACGKFARCGGIFKQGPSRLRDVPKQGRGGVPR